MQVETRFDDSHFAPDPRPFYGIMQGLDYRNAAWSTPVFAAAADAVARLRDLDNPKILDMASGYGVVSALLRYRVGLSELLQRYVEPTIEALSAAELIERDRAWFEHHGLRDAALRTVALDISEEALAYGQRVGLFDETFAEDVAETPPSAALRQTLQDCALWVEAGSIAHLDPGILRSLLAATGARKPWIITAPVRGNHRDEAFAAMRDAGLVVEQLPLDPFPIRRFVDAAEQERACAEIRRRGLDPEGIETRGYYHGSIYLARPVDEMHVPGAALVPATVARQGAQRETEDV